MAKMFIKKVCTISILALLPLLLSSCGHMKRKDGPPNFYVDETKVPNAVPKKEPLSKYGNMTSYRVFGKRYYTMKSSRNFTQVGTASWYGTSFHARNTSSGEPYDMLAMTAAHKTLPLPTYVEVTNLRNQRKIIVKVNDRGPFASDRIIDLSYVAAKKLGMIGHGTTKVRLKAINPLSPEERIQLANRGTKNKSIATKVKSKLYLQTGGYEQLASAKRAKCRLQRAIKAPISITRGNTGSRFYKLRIGPMKDAKSADKISKHLENLGMLSVKKIGA